MKQNIVKLAVPQQGGRRKDSYVRETRGLTQGKCIFYSLHRPTIDVNPVLCLLQMYYKGHLSMLLFS